MAKADIRMAAMNMLAMREQSAKELSEKLLRKFKDPQAINSVVDQLINESLQSDTRFTEAFTAMRKRQGKGPVIIRLELLAQGVGEDLISQYLNFDDPAWTESASNLYKKRCQVSRLDKSNSLDQKERAKQQRFLQSRGFTQQQIMSALSQVTDSESD
jgi:regulatory protein